MKCPPPSSCYEFLWVPIDRYEQILCCFDRDEHFHSHFCHDQKQRLVFLGSISHQKSPLFLRCQHTAVGLLNGLRCYSGLCATLWVLSPYFCLGSSYFSISCPFSSGVDIVTWQKSRGHNTLTPIIVVNLPIRIVSQMDAPFWLKQTLLAESWLIFRVPIR